MRKNKCFILIAISLIFYACERDDICAEGTPTTPRLLIEFFDVSDIETLKSVTRLSAYGQSLVDDGLPVNATEAEDVAILFNSNSNSLQLPLLVGLEGEEITTTYLLEKDTNLRIDENTSTDSNIDVVRITYKPEFVYVSRACGFKSIFTELEIEVVDDGDNWIQNFSFTDTISQSITLENEDATHVQIFH